MPQPADCFVPNRIATIGKIYVARAALKDLSELRKLDLNRLFAERAIHFKTPNAYKIVRLRSFDDAAGDTKSDPFTSGGSDRSSRPT
jgi:hypothetical protein